MSVFLEVPSSAWVASNAHAFAFPDGHPVSPGHTLVVTRRLVPDWFSATEEERLAVLQLIDEVKLQRRPWTDPPRGGIVIQRAA